MPTADDDAVGAPAAPEARRRRHAAITLVAVVVAACALVAVPAYIAAEWVRERICYSAERREGAQELKLVGMRVEDVQRDSRWRDGRRRLQVVSRSSSEPSGTVVGVTDCERRGATTLYVSR